MLYTPSFIEMYVNNKEGICSCWWKRITSFVAGIRRNILWKKTNKDKQVQGSDTTMLKKDKRSIQKKKNLLQEQVFLL